MSAERQSDPAITQALEEVQDALRLEQRALEPLPRETARLRERSALLQAEREVLRRELEALQQGKPVRRPRLPESLVPPFKLRPQVPLRRRLRDAAPFLLAVGLLLWTPWDRLFLPFAIVGLAFAMMALLIQRSPRWRFEQTGLGVTTREGRRSVSYTDVLDAEVYISPSQRRRGVGTVVVTHKAFPEAAEGKSLILKDVPEPERLAEWLRSMRPQKK